ncbi:hypothetical protein C8J56DRAFT_468684 [Mycena floridula]|nr:hypothetical protein C8J56DRAFT_468684 [Mycena floridula]
MIKESPVLVVVDFFPPTNLPHSTPPGHRPLPHDIAQLKVQNTSLFPTQSLRTGMDKWSQVWIGSKARRQSSKAWLVVIKIFQQSFFPTDDYHYGGRAKPEVQAYQHFARNEAVAFAAMSNLQGRKILCSKRSRKLHTKSVFVVSITMIWSCKISCSATISLHAASSTLHSLVKVDLAAPEPGASALCLKTSRSLTGR